MQKSFLVSILRLVISMRLYLANTSKHKSEILNTVYLKHEYLNIDHDECSNKELYNNVKVCSGRKYSAITGVSIINTIQMK